ncbi:Ni2+ ABC transporter permease NikM [Candidatus Electronema halotolerans]
MHISEGVLSAPVLISGGVTAAVGTIIGLRKIEWDNVMPTALLSSTFFVASLVHVPIGPGSVHLILNGLVGLILGWGCFPAILIALFLQALFFQFGGLIVLGVNTTTMALPAVCCHYLTRRWLEEPKTRAGAAFAVGLLSILFSALLTSLALALSDMGFLTTAKVLVVAHVPVMIIEGFITMFVAGFIAKVQPEILHLQPVTVKS